MWFWSMNSSNSAPRKAIRKAVEDNMPQKQRPQDVCRASATMAPCRPIVIVRFSELLAIPNSITLMKQELGVWLTWITTKCHPSHVSHVSIYSIWRVRSFKLAMLMQLGSAPSRRHYFFAVLINSYHSSWTFLWILLILLARVTHRRYCEQWTKKSGSHVLMRIDVNFPPPKKKKWPIW